MRYNVDMAGKKKSKESGATAVESLGTTENAGAVYSAPDETSSASGQGLSGAAPDVKPKLSIPLLDSGGIDLDSMRETSRAKLKAALSATPSLSAPAGSALTEKDCEYLYALLSGARIFAAVRFLGIPSDIAERVLPYTSDQIHDLVEPTRETAAMLGVNVLPPYAKLFMTLLAIDMGNMMEIKIQLARIAAARTGAGPVAVAAVQ